jgi:hypothetical protein
MYHLPSNTKYSAFCPQGIHAFHIVLAINSDYFRIQLRRRRVSCEVRTDFLYINGKEFGPNMIKHLMDTLIREIKANNLAVISKNRMINLNAYA